MLLWLTLGLWLAAAVAHLAPGTALGRWCRNWAVDRPARWIGGLSRWDLLRLLLGVAALAVLAPALPADAVFLLASDMAAYLEVLAAVAVVAVRSRASREEVAALARSGRRATARFARGLRTGARRRSRRIRRVTPPSDADEGEAHPRAFASA